MRLSRWQSLAVLPRPEPPAALIVRRRRTALKRCRWGAPNATDVSQVCGPFGCTERKYHSADLGFLRWLALKRAFF